MGESSLQHLKANDMSDYFELIREFETKKRMIRPNSDGKIVTRIPVQLVEQVQSKGKNIQQRIQLSKFNGQVKHARDKLIFEHSIIRDLFTESINSIVACALDIMKQHPKIKTILTVGGYAECELLRDKLYSDIPDCKIVLPKESGLAVLKGAVLYGHQPHVISARKLRYTYGVGMADKFIKDVHPESHKFLDEKGNWRCVNAFRGLLSANTTVDSSGLSVKIDCCPITRNQRDIETMVFCSLKKNPIVVDDGSCILIGRVCFSIPQYKGHGADNRYVEVTFTFGLSELLVEVFVPETGEKLESEFQLL